MEYDAAGFEIKREDEGDVFDVGSLYARLDMLTDKRKARGPMRPPLHSLSHLP